MTEQERAKLYDDAIGPVLKSKWARGFHYFDIRGGKTPRQLYRYDPERDAWKIMEGDLIHFIQYNERFSILDMRLAKN